MGNSTNEIAKQRIVAGARRHFLAHGFRSVTMDDLASELGMSKKTLYLHFPSKKELLKEIVMTKLAEAERDLAGIAADRSAPFPERLRGMLDTMRRHAAELSPAFVRDMGRDAPEVFTLVQERRRELISRHWRSVIEDGQRQRMIRRDIPIEVMLGVLAGAADAVVNPRKVDELGMTPREAFGAIVTLFIEGASTEKGRMQL